MAKKISASVGKGGKNKPIDTSGQATLSDSLDNNAGNPPPSAALAFSAPASGVDEQLVVAFPIGDEFIYDPIELGPATSLDFVVDVFAESLAGASRVEVTMAVLQDGFFIAAPTSSTPSMDGSEVGWARLSHAGLEANDFLAADGGGRAPDFSRPFQFSYAFHADYSATTLGVDLRIDNMEATVNTIPEPGSAALVMAMGAAILWDRWWNDDNGPR